MTADTAMIELIKSLCKAQGEMEGAKKGKVNPAFKSKYADLDAVMEAIREPLSSNGLAFVQTMDINESNYTILTTTLWHVGGASISSRMLIPVMGGKAQDLGSFITYYRRYSLMALVGIAPEDDDGNAASGKPSVETKAAPAKAEYVKATTAEQPTRKKPTPNTRSAQDKQALKDLLAKVPSYEEEVYLNFTKLELDFDRISDAHFDIIKNNALDILNKQGAHAAA